MSDSGVHPRESYGHPAASGRADDAPVEERTANRQLNVALAEIEQLRQRSVALAARNAEIELRLANATAELEKLQAADNTEELRQRVKTLTEHLDTADHHVASLKARLDQQSAVAARHGARIEERLREREVNLNNEIRRLSQTLASDTAKLQQRVEELELANAQIAAESKAASSAAVRQRQSLESRVHSLLADIEDIRKRDAEAIGDRDKTLRTISRELESCKSTAAIEKTQLRQNLAESEARRQREAAQQAKTVDGMKSVIATLESELQAAREAGAAERRRAEAALADERERARILIDARDEQRRRIEARAEAAEKQAAGATATAAMEVARANQLSVQLNAERARSEEIEALQQHVAALAAQRAADQSSSNLIIEELRLRLAEVAGEEAAASAVAHALERRNTLLDELAALRARVATLDADAAPAAAEVGDDDAAAVSAGETDRDVHEQVRQVLTYAQSLEGELGEMRARLDAALQPASDQRPSVVQVPAWRRNLFGGARTEERRVRSR